MLGCAVLLALVTFNLQLATSQKDPGVFDGWHLCGKTFADANGTGIFPFHVQIGDQTVHASWASTLWQNETTTNIGTWYSTHGLNYSDDFKIDFDVCTLIIGGMTQVAQIRGQNDNGNCLTTMDQSCVDALETQASNAANVLVEYKTGSPTTNLTKGVLPTVCQDIAQNIQNNFPKECNPYFDKSLTQLYPFGLTDHNGVLSDKGCCSSVEEYAGNCTITGDSPAFNPYYATGWTDYDTHNGNHSHYDNLSYTIDTSLQIFLPIANVERPQSFGSSVSKLTCIHIDHFNNDSRVPPHISVADVTPKSKKLSGGAIAGIVVGCVAAAVIGIVIIAYCWRRRRRRKALPKAQATTAAELGEDEMAEAPSGPGRAELNPEIRQRTELADGQAVGVELPNSMTERVELPTNEPYEKPEVVGDLGGTELETQPAEIRLPDGDAEEAEDRDGNTHA